MAKGWESKSVEEQQSEAERAAAPAGPRLSPAEAERARRAEGLELARKRVLAQLEKTENPRYRELLERELAGLDAQLAALRTS